MGMLSRDEIEALEHVIACKAMTGVHTINGCPRHDDAGYCVFTRQLHELSEKGVHV